MILERGGESIAYEAHGPADAPLLVFCHGVSLDRRAFAPQVDAFAGRCRVVVWDMPGHGESPEHDPKRMFVNCAAEWVVRLMDHLGAEQAVLVGQSLGSFVSQRAAFDHPGRIPATAHIGGAALHPRASAFLPLAWRLLEMVVAQWPIERLAEAFAESRGGTAQTRAYMRECALRFGSRKLLALSRESLEFMARGLPKPLPGHLLLACGEDESSWLKRQSTRWHARHPHSRLAMIPGAGHLANLDKPEAFNRALAGFLGLEEA